MSGIMNMLVAAKTTVAAAVDEFFNRVTLLLNTSSTNGAQNNTFLDSSSNNFTITRNGNTTQGTFTPFSQTGWGNYFDGNGDGFTISNSAEFDFGSGDFTIELWASFETHSHTHHLVSKRTSSGATNTNWTLEVVSGVANFYASNGSTFFINLLGGGVVSSIGVWYHIAVTRSGNDFKMFINGTQAGSTLTSSSSISSTSRNLNIGLDPLNSSNRINGYVSNLRIVKGTALYTSNFTPTTSPLTTVSGTSLLTCQSNRFIDNSSNAFAITLNGNPSIQAFSPFAPTASYDTTTVGGSGYFDGTGDYLSVGSAGQSQFNLGSPSGSTNNFTLECWFYPTAALSASTYNSLFGCHDGVDPASYAVYVRSNGVFLYGSGNTFTGGGTVNSNAWNHAAIVRSTNVVTVYLNGIQVDSQTRTGDYNNTSDVFQIGDDNSSNLPFTGYISNLRVVKGTAIYSGSSTTTPNFTLPTAPFTATMSANPFGGSNTSAATATLLTNFTNAGIYDAAAKNVLETVGNAQVNTTQAKFGTTSMYFDGTGDALAIPTSQKENLRFGTGNFTIEFWAWKSANGSAGYDTVISVATSGNASGGFILELSSNRGFGLAYDSTFAISSNFNPNDSTWHHYAIVRNGSTFALYKDGTQLTTATLTPTLGINGDAFVGSAVNSSTVNFNGYIDDLRVSKFARYTTSFTAPTAAFPVQ